MRDHLVVSPISTRYVASLNREDDLAEDAAFGRFRIRLFVGGHWVCGAYDNLQPLSSVGRQLVQIGRSWF